MPKHLNTFIWNNGSLVVSDNYIDWKDQLISIDWVNDLCFYHSHGIKDHWYYIWAGTHYHCIKYKGGSGYITMFPISRIHNQIFKWNNKSLMVYDNYIDWQGKLIEITWVNDLCFYHSHGIKDHWYYIWAGTHYHCIKYKGGSGYITMFPDLGSSNINPKKPSNNINPKNQLKGIAAVC
eukprot:TRINITY_DN3949_c0_g1_i1.p1 TRINITY_DN3949_c0_g1~~TRINITY_DN3949_c0_g1_i1.p1  ORF type:complete len:179 (-),score=27.56 TRINITY_DN3949_c0_g1_i1:22-558(-)